MATTFKKIQDRLRAKKYVPLPTKELNNLALKNEDTEKVIDSCQRLILKVMSRYLTFVTKPDHELVEIFQVLNIALFEAIKKYKSDKLDFSLFAYYELKNRLLLHQKFSGHIKSRVVDGERKYATYTSITEVFEMVDEEEVPWIPAEPPKEIKEEIPVQLIKKELMDVKYPLSESVIDVFFEYCGFFDGIPKTNKEVAEKMGISAGLAGYSIRKVIDTIKKNEKLMQFLKQYI